MIPITRKELYLNKIVGNNDYETPEKPITTEEFFFAEILGEAVQAPEPLTRYQIYLAKIAGRNIEIPYPETRFEYFLARAAGMDVETPTPITREEIFWSNYSAIVDFEVEGVPPLTYKAIEGTLENYRIYGNTVGGESVGDLVTSGEHAGEYKVPVTVEGKNLLPNADWVEGYIARDGRIVEPSSSMQEITSPFVKVIPGKTYVFSYYPNEGEPWKAVIYYTEDKMFIKRQSARNSASPVAFTVESGVGYARFSYRSYGDGTFSQLELGDTVTDYEPYHAPVTTPIYLPEPIKMVGDEAEYIDYAEQKMHRVRKNLLPTLTTTYSANGIEITPNSDGGLIVNGTATATSYAYLRGSIVFPFDTIVSGGLENGSVNTYCLRAQNMETKTNVATDYGDGALIPANTEIYLEIRIQNGTVCDNLTFYPMIRKADIEDDTYEPYIKNTDLDVTLPALPTLTGTNVLSVGTAVQPSKVYVKYKGERQ